MASKKSPFFIVTIGASAGGLNAICELSAQLSPDINAAFFVVLHLSSTSVGEIFVSRIQKYTSLKCKVAQHETIQAGILYVAPPNVHLLVKENKIVIGHGPIENRFRPSIDVLFRSAAVAFRERVIGIILSGLLNDGTSGMSIIKQAGGYCIVQDPNEAEYPDMPLAVMDKMEVDESLPLSSMGAAILKRTLIQTLVTKELPEKIIAESMISERAATGIDKVKGLGEKALYSCPDCGGNLWEIRDDNGNGKGNGIKHYRCQIGHSYSEEDLDLKQSQNIEQTLWVAVRMMEERRLMLTKLGKEHQQRGLNQIGERYHQQAQSLEDHIEQLKQLLFIVSRGNDN
jgi:two-component system chemotaxis response regulator CheB